MDKKRSGETSRTVIIATDVCGYSAHDVALAVDIAASVNSGLQGLFIEDEDLLTLSSSPLTREISLTTANSRPASSERLQRTLRAVARQFETTLQREAQALSITWSYQYIRGRTRDICLAAGVDAGFAVLGGTSLRPVDNRTDRGRRKVLVVVDHSARWKQALSILVSRFAGASAEITLVADSGGKASQHDLRASTGFTRPDLNVVRVDRELLADLLARRGSSFDYAILPMHETAEMLADILGAIRCPAILVA